MNYEQIYKAIVKKHLKRGVEKNDGCVEKEIAKAEKGLGVRIPKAIREYYRIVGNNNDLNKYHNYFYDLKELVIDDEYLLFMDENQCVVSWGIKVSDINDENPEIWQRNNTEPVQWHSEEMAFTEFIQKMFEWVFNSKDLTEGV